MAGFIQAYEPLPDYRGLPGIFEFCNEDGALCRFNCGQAAVATLLRHLDPASAEQKLMSWLERDHGPDNLGGWLGSSKRRVERGLRARGHRPRAIRGEAALRRTLERRIPVIVTFQLSAGRFWRFDLPGAHWVVLFGFDGQHVHLTNWWQNRLAWDEFLLGWHGWVPALTNMRATGLIVSPEAP